MHCKHPGPYPVPGPRRVPTWALAVCHGNAYLHACSRPATETGYPISACAGSSSHPMHSLNPAQGQAGLTVAHGHYPATLKVGQQEEE